MIFEIYIWLICFVSVYVSLFWMIISSKKLKKIERKDIPYITIGVPAYNEEKSIRETLESLANLDYPRNKLEIIVVNDGSKDKTKEIVEKFISENKDLDIRLINQENKGKGAALNNAIKGCKGVYFGVFDADSKASKDILKNLIKYFDSDEVGAVITAIKVHNPKTTVEKIQRLEYIFSSFIRKLMGMIGTLHTTHGVLSLFRKDIIKKLGGFDEHNLTEDFEIAMRLRYHNYEVRMCEEGWCYTTVPKTFRELWVQRVRWFRGFMHNSLKYKEIVLNKKYGLLGKFQIPLELLTLIFVFTSVSLIGFNFIKQLVNFFSRILIYGWEVFAFELPTIKELILSLNWNIFFPTIISLIAGIYLYFKAHFNVEENWKFHIVSFIYLFVYPLLRSLQWIHAFILESTNARKKWR
jgi:poly-beta-1,6-N-acetyl-D-glucosamine synthase